VIVFYIGISLAEDKEISNLKKNILLLIQINIFYKNTKINIIKNNEVIIIKNAGVNPINFRFFNFVFAPTEAIAIRRHHLLISLKNNFIL